MLNRFLVLCASVFALALTACTVEYPVEYNENDERMEAYDLQDPEGEPVDMPMTFNLGDVTIDAPRLFGSIERANDLNNYVTDLSSEYDNTLYMQVNREHDAVMLVLGVSGGFGDLEPGFYSRQVTYGETVGAEEGDVLINGYGCAGPAPYDYDFDGSFDTVDMNVEDLGDGTSQVDFTTRWDREDYEVSGSFTVINN